MGQLGLNVAGRAEYSPEELKATGATWLRCVAYPDFNLVPWINQCHKLGMKVLLVIGSETVTQVATNWGSRLWSVSDRYRGVADAFQVGNEPDGEGESSWKMSQHDFQTLLFLTRTIMGNGVSLIAGGLCSGQPSWLDTVDLSVVDAIGVHPYAKDPYSPELNDMLDSYYKKNHNKRIWCTEFNGRTIGMATYLCDHFAIEASMAFCYTDRMVPGFGIKESPVAWASFLLATGVPGYLPEQDKSDVETRLAGFTVGSGFQALFVKNPVWRPLSDERWYGYGASYMLIQHPDGVRFLYWTDRPGKLWLGPVLEEAV